MEKKGKTLRSEWWMVVDSAASMCDDLGTEPSLLTAGE